jgi:hypothetical protein
MAMTNNFFIFLTIILSILLISVDVVFFSFRQRKYANGKSLLLTLQDFLHPALTWLENQWGRLSKLPSLLAVSALQASSEPVSGVPNSSDEMPSPDKNNSAETDAPTATPGTGDFPKNSEPVPGLETASAPNNTDSQLSQVEALTHAASVENQTAMTVETIPTETNPQQNETTLREQKMVRIQFTADIPEGTIVNVNLEVVDGQGKSFITKTILARDVTQGAPTALPDQANKIQTLSATNQPGEHPVQAAWLKQIFARAGQIISAAHQAVVSRVITWNFELKNLDQLLLLATITIYALAVSIGIDRFPVYFFTDEAIHMNLASDFIRDGFKNYYGEFLPTFFSVEGWVNGTSVYVQVLPFLIFGKSVVVTRLVSAFISLLGALAIGLLLKDVFKFKYYWAGIFLVLTTPAWFLHSRTAFEYVEVGSFYSIFLYFYARYRAGYLRSLYWAIIAGALAFYAHGLGQILMSVTGLALFIVDFRYHIHPDRRKTVLNGLLLGAILLLPFARYYWAHPNEAAAQVKRRGSYWSNDSLTFAQKMGQFFGQYGYGLSPSYWYFPNPVDIIRHIMYKYGNGLWYTLPLVVVGLIQSFKNIRQPAYRMVLIALLACPVPASVVAIGMPRMLFMTLPLALLGMIGLSAILEWGQGLELGQKKWHIPSTWIASLLFILLAGLSIFMLRDALVNGPSWFEDYSLYGLQYGAKQVFQDVVRTGLEQDSNRIYVVSPSWANGTEQFVAFFIPKDLQSRVRMGQPVDLIDTLKKNPTDLYFVATSDEYDKLINNPEFTDIKVEQMLPFPDGRPGFYVISLSVSDNIDQIISAQQKLAITPVEDTMTLNDQTVRVIHSPLGGGSLQDVFDTNPDSLAKVLQANPFTFDLYLPTPIDTKSVVIQTGSLPNFTVTISLYAPGATDPIIYTQTFQGLPPDPLVTINFDKGPAKSARIYIEIKDNTSGDTSQIHVRTINFK